MQEIDGERRVTRIRCTSGINQSGPTRHCSRPLRARDRSVLRWFCAARSRRLMRKSLGGSPTSSPCRLSFGAFSRKSFPCSSRPAVSDSWSGMATSQGARSRTRRRIRCASVKRPRGCAWHHRRTRRCSRPLRARSCPPHPRTDVLENRP